jgi:hypothetical protein
MIGKSQHFRSVTPGSVRDEDALSGLRPGAEPPS